MTRKIVKTGSSLAVTLPKEVVDLFRLKAGDEVEVSIHPQTGAVILRAGTPYFEDGNVASARLFYERAANEGLAQGAMALAATYDPDEIARRNLRGVTPDAKTAARWYQRARQLGASGAEERLRRISGR